MEKERDGGEDASASARPGSTIGDHFATLRGTKGRFLWREIVLQLALPIAAAVATVWFQVRISVASDIIAGSAVLSGFLFGLVIFVFQLRLSITNDPRVQSKASLPDLIDQLFSNVLYAVGVSFALTTLVIVAAATEPADAKTHLPLGVEPLVSAVLVGMAAHLLAVVWMSIRRTRRAYSEIKR